MRLAAGLFCILLAGTAQAQPAAAPTENVTVTGARSRQVPERFVESFATPTRMTGKLARWEDGVCPITAGLPAKFAAFMTARVKDVAAQVGAPVNVSASCKPNIEIVFTTVPQKLLDNIRKQQSEYLGYVDNTAQLDALATVTHPIQAWYATQTKDLRGQAEFDSAKGGGIDLVIPDPFTANAFIHLSMPHAHARAVTGSRLGDGTRSSFFNVIIVADPNALLKHEMGPLADYIALLALAQISSLDTCQQLASIVNLLAPNCDRKPSGLTDSDLGYLRGIYKMGADRTGRVQQDEIAYQMQKAQDGK
jgi:hypothetical protein